MLVNTDTPCEIILLEHNADDNIRSYAVKVKVTSESHLGSIRRKSFNNSFKNAKYYIKLLSGAKTKYVEHYIITSPTKQKPNITVIYNWKE